MFGRSLGSTAGALDADGGCLEHDGIADRLPHLGQYVENSVGVEDEDQYDVCIAYGIPHACSDRRTVDSQRLGLRDRAVPDMHREIGAEQAPGGGRAHDPGTEYCHLHRALQSFRVLPDRHCNGLRARFHPQAPAGDPDCPQSPAVTSRINLPAAYFAGCDAQKT